MRIAIFSKERLFLDALSSLVDQMRSISVVAKEISASEFLIQSKVEGANVLLIDYKTLAPEDIQFILGARAVGNFLLALIVDQDTSRKADLVISRSSSGSELFEALSALLPLLPPVDLESNNKRSYRTGNSLTRREIEVAELVAKGMSNRTIAEVSDIHEQSVKNLISVIMRKLNCENRTQVALKLLSTDLDHSVN